jgi:transcriptional regulator with XRE-family HTH domain
VGQKKTELDERYAKAFAKEVRPHYLLAKKKGMSDRAFADTLGVTDTQLHNYLEGAATPSLRTVAVALERYAIAVPYGSIPTKRLLGIGAKKAARPEQLVLPFSIHPRAAKRIGLRVERHSGRKIDLVLKIG